LATDLRAAPLFARSGSCFRIVEMHLRVGRMAGLFKPSRIAGRRFRRDDLGSNSKGHFMAAARVGRDLILCMSVSLDGFVARRDGVIDWLDSPGADSSGADRHRAVLELLGQIDTIVLGRGAYEEMSRGWPGSENPMGVLMNTLPKVVFSTSLDGVDWDNAS
jgi:RibD C-terminal domain